MALTSGPASNQLWTGLAADIKPDGTNQSLRYGALFFESDTFKWYLWNGANWLPTNTGAVTAGAYPVPPTA